MRRSLVATGATVAVLTGGLLAFGALGGQTPQPDPTPSAVVVADPQAAAIAALQSQVATKPTAETWAALGLAYVGKAKATGDPSWYAKAEGAVANSLKLGATYPGWTGEAALANARHDFRGAEAAARKGLALNAYNSTLYGQLGDALTQLGRYDEAAAAIDRMNQLQPGIPAFTRASYVFELRGDVAGARTALERALTDARSGPDIAFARYYLGELDLRYGAGAASALTQYQAGLAASPKDAILRAGRAKAEAALGQIDEAIADYRASVSARPEPTTVLEFAQLLDSVGDKEATDFYDLFRVQLKLYAAAGVALDTEATLFEADHGTPAAALTAAVAGWKSRPFVEMADAYAWALYSGGRYREALGWSAKAFASGWKPALALYHRGMIEKALGQRSAARADLTEALRLDPHFDPLAVPKARAALASL